MSLACSVLGHSEASNTVSNEGYQFSTCTRCGIDLVQSGEGRWIAPPRGFRIVKRARVKPPKAEEATPDSAAAPDRQIPNKNKRKVEDRRIAQADTRPVSLRTIDRRRSDRREGSGNYLPNRRKGLIAE